MFLGLISIAMLAWAGYLLKNPIDKGDEEKSLIYTRILQFALVGVGLFLLGSRSFVIIGANEVGHLERIYLAADLPPGKIIAPDGEKGPQSEIIGPGFHFMPFVRILNEVNTDVPVIEIAEGQYGILNAKDGLPLRQGQFIADAAVSEEAGLADVQILAGGNHDFQSQIVAGKIIQVMENAQAEAEISVPR